LTELRSKEVTDRPLDREKIKGRLGIIQGLNLVLPIALVILFGYLRHQRRKRKNEKPT
jgi:hypothetical protein